MKLRLIDYGVIVNLLVVIFNIAIAFLNLSTGNNFSMIFNIGCAICSGLMALICAVIRK